MTALTTVARSTGMPQDGFYPYCSPGLPSPSRHHSSPMRRRALSACPLIVSKASIPSPLFLRLTGVDLPCPKCCGTTRHRCPETAEHHQHRHTATAITDSSTLIIAPGASLPSEFYGICRKAIIFACGGPYLFLQCRWELAITAAVGQRRGKC